MEEQEKQAVKQTPADLYLMVPKNSKTGVRVTLLSVKKIKSFAEVANKGNSCNSLSGGTCANGNSRCRS